MPSASCCFSMFFTSQKINIKWSPNATKLHDDFLWARTKAMFPGCTWGFPEGGTTHLGAPGEPGAPWWVVPTSVTSHTTSLLCKYPNISKTLGKSRKHNSSRHKVQKPQIQSKHHHRGVHHPHWCLSDDM